MIETRIDALDFLAQLGDELVFDYEVEDETITTIVIDLLSYQENLSPIGIGTIEPVVTRSISIQQDTVMGALMKLRETVGGYISVNNDGDLDWLNDIGENKGQQIRYKKNIKGLSRTREYTNFGNRLYCYGAGEGSARIRLSQAAGWTEDYVENIPSQNANGMCIRQLTDKSITDPDVLLAWAQLRLAEMKDPRANYRVDMVNLAAMGWDFEALQLGSMVKVIDEDMGIDIDARIVKIIRDLSDPANIQVEISNPGKDIIDTMGGVYDNQQFQDHIATKIGAGQVVVLGTFVVSDWLTAGTTLIKGDYIRSGTLESTNWGAGAGSQFNLNDGTFMLGGSTAPKLSWDGTNLVVQGTIYATAGEFTGTLKATNIEAGKTLTVNGEILTGSGNIKLTSTALKTKGIPFEFYYGDTYVGIFGAAGATNLSLISIYDLILEVGAARTLLLGRSGTTYQVNLDSVFYPYTTNTIDFGKSANRWKDVYAQVFRPESSTSGGVILNTQANAKPEEGSISYAYYAPYLYVYIYAGGAWRTHRY